ncbi:hypothetical protein [Neorhizobium sp. LjRoot104]|uniref:hypothetical protein n=1 Tax=Neorhizobium sp. LjRoot104 TaxID=3342254 RepID=UPI003ED012F9
MAGHLSRMMWPVFPAALLAMPAGAADLSKLRQPGAYVILSDSQGKAISGAYWLSPELKFVVHSEDAATPAMGVFVDREMFPRRIAQFEIFLNVRLTYDPEPGSLPVGKVGQIRQTEKLPNSDPKTSLLAFATTGIVSSKLQDIDIVSRSYGVDGDQFGVPGRKTGERVHIEPLDIDLSAADAARVAAVETGEALSSLDFHMLYVTRALPSALKVVKCFEEVRASAQFQTAAKKLRETMDQWMATTFMIGGKTWWDRDKVSPEDFGPDVASLCPDP